jgi:ATP-dependent helicase/DNAse subunit B
MQISSLRSSSANCYENCPHQYFLNYCIGFESIPNKKTELGTLVHRCAEILARSKKNNHLKNKDKCSDPNFVLDIVWNKLTRKNQHNFVFSDDDKQFCREQLQNIINSEYNPLKLNPIATEIQFEIEIRRPEFKYDFVDFKTLKKTSGYMLLRGFNFKGLYSLLIIFCNCSRQNCLSSSENTKLCWFLRVNLFHTMSNTKFGSLHLSLFFK